MTGTALKNTAAFIGLLAMSILFMQFVWNFSESDKKAAAAPDKINLALRRTADALLREAGDSTSGIPPVEQTSERVWLVRMERTFNYERLPELLQASFDVHGIRFGYDAAVLRCTDGALMLGYNFRDVFQNQNVPCSGRTLAPDCYNLQVTLAAMPASRSKLPPTAWLLSAVLALALFGLGRPWRRIREKERNGSQPPDPDWLHFGQSRLDVQNQVLTCGNTSHRLTFREAKLLQLFARHPNQVLERSFILDNVWADEGVLVGRSVDMFVSRLRKLLRDDPSIQLVAVHGVGYRMDAG